MTWSEHGALISTGNAQITFLPPTAFAARFAPFAPAVSLPSPRLAALRLRTSSLEQTREVWRTSGVGSVETADGTLLIAPDHACGTILEFAAA